MDVKAYKLSKNYTDQRVSEITGLNYSDINAKLDSLIDKTRMTDTDTGKTYEFKFKQQNGHVVMEYEEVL